MEAFDSRAGEQTCLTWDTVKIDLYCISIGRFRVLESGRVFFSRGPHMATS